MKLRHGKGPVTLVLSRRNLEVLLAKLDDAPTGSACAILGGEDAPDVLVIAEENHVHYAKRSPGKMHPDTEAAITNPRFGI